MNFGVDFFLKKFYIINNELTTEESMNLRESRKLKGLRQGQLAFLAGVTQGEISVPFGDGGNPSPSGEEKVIVVALCDFTNSEHILRRT